MTNGSRVSYSFIVIEGFKGREFSIVMVFEKDFLLYVE